FVDPDDQDGLVPPLGDGPVGTMQCGRPSRTGVVDVGDRDSADPDLLDDALTGEHAAECVSAEDRIQVARSEPGRFQCGTHSGDRQTGVTGSTIFTHRAHGLADDEGITHGSSPQYVW